MSKERARRRAERLAQAERERSRRERARLRRDGRRAVLRRLRPWLGGRQRAKRSGARGQAAGIFRIMDRRTGKMFARRSRGERAGIAVSMLLVLGVIWLLVDSLALRIAFTAMVIVAAPALIVIALDRRI